METQNLMKIIVSAVIGVVVFAAILIPVVGEATTTEKTLTNEGYYYMTPYDNTDTHTIGWDYTKPNIITVDGEDITVGYTVKSGSCTVATDTDWILRYYTDANGNGRAFGFISSTTAGTVSASTADQTNARLTLTEGTLSGTISSTSVSETYTDVYIISKEGEYIMKNASVDAYINADSTFVAYGMTTVNTASSTYSAGLSFVGNYEDGVTATAWKGSDNVTLSEVTVNATEQTDYVDIYKLQSITAVATYTETVDDETVTTDTDVTYTYLIVPYQVTSELTHHLSSGEIAILDAIPVMVIVALVIAALGIAVTSRRD